MKLMKYMKEKQRGKIALGTIHVGVLLLTSPFQVGSFLCFMFFMSFMVKPVLDSRKTHLLQTGSVCDPNQWVSPFIGDGH